MTEAELKQRTKQFALRIMNLIDALPKNQIGKIIGQQLLRCGTSVGANYRAACRGRSKADFIAKLGIVVEESDESAYWLELIIEGALLKRELVLPLLNEANEFDRDLYFVNQYGQIEMNFKSKILKILNLKSQISNLKLKYAKVNCD